MEIVDARTGIEHLTREECLVRLADDVVGRLGFIDGGAPMVVPVNYAMDGEDVIVRTDRGGKLDRGTRARACFEIDSFDRATRSGWSVVVSGRLEEVTVHDPGHRRLPDLGVDPWADGERTHWLRLVPTRVTGRRIRPRPGVEGPPRA